MDSRTEEDKDDIDGGGFIGTAPNDQDQGAADISDGSDWPDLPDWQGLVGNGPYMLAFDMETGERDGLTIFLQKNPYYANPDRGLPFEAVEWRLDGDVNLDHSDLLNSKMDAISSLPAEVLAEETQSPADAPKEAGFPSSDGTVCTQEPISDVLGIFFNCRSGALADARVRRALSLAADRTYLAGEVLGGLYAPMSEMIHVPAFTQYAQSANIHTEAAGRDGRPAGAEDARGLLQQAGDPEVGKARGLLQEAGYPEGEGIPVLACLTDREGAAFLASQYLASAWKELGLEVEIVAADADELADKRERGDFDILCGNLVLPSDLPRTELLRFASESDGNDTGFFSDKYDRLMAEAAGEKDEEKWARKIARAIEVLDEEAPAAPLAARVATCLRPSHAIVHKAAGAVATASGQAEGTANGKIAENASGESGGIYCDTSGCWQLWKEMPDPFAQEAMDRGETSQARDAAPGAFAREPGEAVGETSQAPDAAPGAFAREPGAGLLPLFKSGEGESGMPQANLGMGIFPGRQMSALSAVRMSDQYFEKADRPAWLTRQAWVLDDVGGKGDKVVSLPKYAQVHLTGTGNVRYARIDWGGIFHYIEANCVTAEPAVLDQIRAEEAEDALQREIVSAPTHGARESALADRAEDLRAETDRILAEIAHHEMVRTQTRNPNWDGPVLSRSRGSVWGPSGKETYYNLNMSGVVSIMRRMGNTDEYWIRDDGCKMLGDYIMCAANLGVHPRGSLVECSLGTCIVCDTGGFASRNARQLDIAVTW